MSLRRLERDFFEQNTVEVAQNLLGKIMVFQNFKGIIFETEAYRGNDDPASHAHRGSTPRTQVMFERGGISYVYFIYGMYHCLNFVTEREGAPGAVLIRGLQLLEPEPKVLEGPGKICRHLFLTKEHHGIDVVQSDSFYLLEDLDFKKIEYASTSRTGIQKGKEKLWRFVIDVPK
ncbi:MAG: 3-methyladenine DNA glycosylase [Alphaproteobacteria bacterium 16-39-46]|nr:MAG: 3-methyladenine DNA glycosylase [Alphaproteobacteria bacterium 16-39-46]OZA42873.1 MAG: 3-methyladenine DNA glycosylase [Alphaproteobacteria bacterium 17-39-52]HQS84249.1 DNA-3-methyladenine glycosylase [Alphaproteobacteria bacterium]HQS94099.1 DNA-3-methyladenine glycosylase [Alphaproteobacteria bacterium]